MPWLHRVLFCIALACCTAACAVASDSAARAASSEKIRIKVWELPRQGEEVISLRARRAVFDAFMAKPENQNVELTPFTLLRAGGMDLEVGPLMGMAAGTAPDLLYVNFRKSDTYVQEGFLQPLDEFIDPEGKYRVDATHPFPDDEVPDILKDRVPKPVWKVIYRKGPDGGKHIYCLPIGTGTITLMYRKDLFRAAGLDPERPPKTWDEFYEAAKRLFDPEQGIYGIGLPAGPYASWALMSFLWGAGGDAVVQDENGVWRAVYDSKEAARAYDFYRKLVQDPVEKYGKVYNGVALRTLDLYTSWRQGKIAMVLSYMESGLLAQGNPEQMGIAPVPIGPSGRSSSEVNSAMVGISANTTDPEKRRKAFELIWYLDSTEARRISVEEFVKAGYGQFVNPVWLKQFGYTEYLRRVPQSWVETYESALANGTPEPYGKNCDLIYRELTTPLDEVVADFGYLNMSEEERLASIKTRLEAAVGETNVKMLGLTPPEQQRFQRWVALAAAVTIALVFALIFTRLYREFTPDWARGAAWGLQKYKWAYLMLLPAAFTVAIWQYYPLLRGAAIAFVDYKVVGKSEIVWLDNFAAVLFDRLFWKSLWNSTVYMLLSLTLIFWPPILLAILLQEVPRGKVLFRVLFYLPAVASGLVIVFLWKNFYDPSDKGLLNQFILLYNYALEWSAGNVPMMAWLNHLRMSPMRWLEDPRLAMLCIILPQMWAGMGPGSIIYLAALKSIPDDFYEAADIDGAGFISKIAHIVIPYLRPLIVINFIGAFIAAFKSMEYVFVMTGGGPALSTHVLGYEIWIRSFMYLKFGVGASMAWILGSLLIGFTSYQLRILSRLQFKTAAQLEKGNA